MKIRNLLGIFLLLGLMGLTNCSDGPEPGVIWDIAPLNVQIRVVDEAGHDLLDPDREDSWADKNIKAIYNGRTFEKDSGVPVKTKAIYVEFTGLRTYSDPNGRVHGLIFGDFNGDSDYRNEEIILDWNDGSKKDTIVFNHDFYWKKHEPKMTTVFYLNGVETESPIVIVKK